MGLDMTEVGVTDIEVLTGEGLVEIYRRVTDELKHRCGYIAYRWNNSRHFGYLDEIIIDILNVGISKITFVITKKYDHLVYVPITVPFALLDEIASNSAIDQLLDEQLGKVKS